MPRNEAPTGPRELATNCFEIQRAMIDESLASWTGLAAAAQLRWIEGGKVAGLDKGKAWPAVYLSAIRTGSLYARMGLRNGDLVYAIDGHSLYSFDSFVTLLSDPSMAKDMDEPQPGAHGDTGPRSMFAMFAGFVEDPNSLSLAVLRAGQAIMLNQVLAGTPVTACEKHPALREKDAEQRTWTEADWQADGARLEERSKEVEQAAAEQKAVTDGITKLTATSFEISASISADAMRNAVMFRSARLVPAVKAGTPNGIAVYAVRPSSVYNALGIENGDRLHTIAGVEVTTPESVVDQLGRLVELPISSIVLTRRGATVTLTYSVR